MKTFEDKLNLLIAVRKQTRQEPDNISAQFRLTEVRLQFLLALQKLSPEERTPEVCLAAVKADGGAIAYLTDEQRTPEMIRLTTLQSSASEASFPFSYSPPEMRTPELCLVAAQQEFPERPRGG